MDIFKKLKIDFFLVFLILIAVFLCYKNYTPNTYLSGWDTLHPGFDLNLYWQRITSVWQEHQGLGAPPSQAHAAEIPRMIVLAILSLLFPPDFIRYTYFFLMMILGPAGVYLLTHYLFNILCDGRIKDCYQSSIHYDKRKLAHQIAAFLGGLFYLLNLGTMQHFIVLLEMFATKFGFLGFLYLFAIKFLNEGKRTNLIIFSLLTILASPMAHTATLWYVYFGGLILFLAAYSLLTKKKDIRKSLLLITLTLLFNLYWILPNLYYVTNYNYQVINSKIHRLGTEELYYHNQKYGKISDLLLFKNFLFDWQITNNSGRTQPLLASWSEHLKNPYILIIGYFLSFLSLIGVIFTIRKKNIILLSFFPILLFSSFFLLSDTPGVSIIFNWLRNTTPLIKEVFRFPFTKFSIYLIFCLSLFFAYLHKVFLNKLSILCQNLHATQGTDGAGGRAPDDAQRRYLKFEERASAGGKPATESGQLSNFFSSLYLYFFLFITVVFALPAFQGNFISEIVRVKIPKEYFSLFNWSKKQNSGRILVLPINPSFGWNYYQWIFPEQTQIYQGAGFTWFGLKQSSLNREFDRWYPYNEQAYREFFYAVYSQNPTLLEKLLSKYNIKYILLDENVVIPGDESQQKKLFYPEIKTLLSSFSNIKLVQKFGQKISLFEFLPNKEKKPVEILTDYKIVQPSYRWNYVDEAYKQYGDYITYTQRPSPIGNFIYPARNILTEQEKINQKILTIGKDSYQISFEKSQLLENGEIKIPALSNTESEFYSEVYAKKNTDGFVIQPRYLLPYIVTDEIYTKQFVFKDQNQRFFSINDKIFSLPSYLSENLTYLGEEILYTQKENNISFYNTDKPETLSTNFPLNLSPYLCSTPQEDQIFGAETTIDGFKIYGQKAKICLEVPLNEMIKVEEDGALGLSFNYQTEITGESEFCLFDKDKNKCVDFSVPIGQEKSKTLYLRLSFDTREESEIKEFLIKNINFNFYKKESGQLFFAEIPQFELTTEEFKLEGKFPQEKVNITAEAIGSEKKDCGFERAKFIDKQFIEEGNGVILEYKATDGSICDAIAFPNLSQNMGYILTIESQNISGLPLKICFENDKTKVCDLEDRLSKNKTMNTDYFVVPPYSNGYGYNLLLNNYSIGNTPSVNRVKAVRVIPFPYNFFQSVRWESENQETTPMNRFIGVEVKQYLPFLYTAKINSPFPDNSLLVLGQAYEKNWRAWINGQELKDHVLVNNWANAWRLRAPKPADQTLREPYSNRIDLPAMLRIALQAGKANGKLRRGWNNTTIVILFLPQYLEFLGFFILGLALIFVIKYHYE